MAAVRGEVEALGNALWVATGGGEGRRRQARDEELVARAMAARSLATGNDFGDEETVTALRFWRGADGLDRQAPGRGIPAPVPADRPPSLADASGG